MRRQIVATQPSALWSRGFCEIFRSSQTPSNGVQCREKPCSIADILELVSAADLYLDCSARVGLLSGRSSIRLSINRCFEQHLAKSEATPAKSLNSHQSRGQAQPIGAVQAKLGPHSGAKF
jgi:GTPase SAR1 family protein